MESTKRLAVGKQLEIMTRQYEDLTQRVKEAIDDTNLSEREKTALLRSIKLADPPPGLKVTTVSEYTISSSDIEDIMDYNDWTYEDVEDEFKNSQRGDYLITRNNDEYEGTIVKITLEAL